ncbi:hypothetical protein D3C87_1638160 [compost metagenome]
MGVQAQETRDQCAFNDLSMDVTKRPEQITQVAERTATKFSQTVDVVPEPRQFIHRFNRIKNRARIH